MILFLLLCTLLFFANIVHGAHRTSKSSGRGLGNRKECPQILFILVGIWKDTERISLLSSKEANLTKRHRCRARRQALPTSPAGPSCSGHLQHGVGAALGHLLNCCPCILPSSCCLNFPVSRSLASLNCTWLPLGGGWRMLSLPGTSCSPYRAKSGIFFFLILDTSSL